MIINPLPTAAEIRLDSRLRPEQVSTALADVAALEADIDGRITEQAYVVEQALQAKARPFAWPFTNAQVTAAFPAYDGGSSASSGSSSTLQRHEVTDREQANAKLVVKYFTLASLFTTAGQLKEAYLEHAKYYLARGEALLRALEEEVVFIASNQTNAVSRNCTTMTTGRGDYTPINPDELTWTPFVF